MKTKIRRKVLLLAASLMVLSTSARATGIPSIESYENLSSPEGALNYMQDFYHAIGKDSYVVIVNNTGFIWKRIFGGDYLVGKMFVTNTRDGDQGVLAIVHDQETGWTQAMTDTDYHYFVNTGNKAYLQERVLEND
jgi:hypothetical protein